jgi:hypothetical protein
MGIGRLVIIILVVGLIVLFGWLIGQGRNILQFGASPSPAPTSTPRTGIEVTVPLEEVDNSNIQGTAVFSEEARRALVRLNVEGLSENSSPPAHIRSGTCDNIGAVRYPLGSVENGRSNTTLAVEVGELLDQLPLAVTVSRSIQENNVYVACGDITAPQRQDQQPQETPGVSPTPTATPSPTP